MKILTKTLAVAIIATAPFASSHQSAQARDDTLAETTRINFNGFQKCKALGNSGFKASVSGTSYDGGGGNFRGGFIQFRVNTCFETKVQCENFIDNINYHVSSIDRLHHAGCFERG